LIDKYGGNDIGSTILPIGRNGSIRKFGSRKHYSHSSENYIKESQKIVELIGRRYGKNEEIIGKIFLKNNERFSNR
jgi:beta-galactosidase